MTEVALSVVVPAFDEAELIEDNLEELIACLERDARPFEVIVVDDGSHDDTAAAVAALAAREPRVRLLSHSRNRGKGRALETGCAAARGEVVVLLDADLEIPADEVHRVVARLEQADVDLVVGSKYAKRQMRRWPLHRRFLSLAYQAVTAVLFRLPLRDTQTGIKAMRRAVALEVLPHVRSRRFAWDLEFVLLAHKAGRRAATVPVRLEPSSRASRVGFRGALSAGFDTARIFIRDRCLAAYGAIGRRPVGRAPRLIVSGDDLGLSPSVNRGLVRGLSAGALTSVSVLAEGPVVDAGLSALGVDPGPGPRMAGDATADLGVHVDLFGPRRLVPWLFATGFGLRAGDVETRVASQVARVRALGAAPSHADTHRHAYFLPWLRRRFFAAVRAGGIPAARSLRPLGPHGPTRGGRGASETAKRLVLLGAATLSAGTGRARGVRVPDGFVDAREAARWVADGRLPGYLQGRTVEVIAHPTVGALDLPAHEAGGIDRAAESRAVFEPPLAAALRALGAEVLGFGEWVGDEGRGR